MKQLTQTLCILLLLSACHHQTQLLSKPKQAADLYVYRIASRLGSAKSHPIYVDNQKIGLLKNGTYLKQKIDPGTHTLSTYDQYGFSQRKISKTITLKAKEKHYIKAQWAPSGHNKRVGLKGHQTWLPHYEPKFISVSQGKAREQLRFLKQK